MSAPGLDSAGLPAGYTFRPDIEITPRQVRDMLAEPGAGLQLIDCRTPEEFRIAAIEGALLIPLSDLASRTGELDPDRPIAVHCHHGGRSLKAALFLRQQGFDDARSVAGGIDLWAIDIDPRVPRY